jgi:hypothetical protein
MFYVKKSVIISNYRVLKLILHISSIIISCKILGPFRKFKHDNTTYMLCMFSGTLFGGWQKFMIKCSNVCP